MCPVLETLRFSRKKSIYDSRQQGGGESLKKVPKWPKKPIAPGENGEIKVTFNSYNRQGKQLKTVTLVTNAIPNTTVLTITGNVIVPAKQ